MFTTSYIESTSVYVFPVAKPSEAQQRKLDLDMANALDAAGDKFKSEGKFESAKACYARALARAIKAGI
jgi:hypothetical protein